jgi:hypothetical protein
MRKKSMPETPVFIPVTVIETRGESVLVEYQAGGLQRVIIPAMLIQGGAVDAEELDQGVPYGLPWETIVKLQATPARLADELRKNGIWTIEDMRRYQAAIFGALQAVYGLELATLINAAETYVAGR